MSLYADTSLLISYYINDSNSVGAQAILHRATEPLPFTGLHRLEMRNALALGSFGGSSPPPKSAPRGRMWSAICEVAAWSHNPSIGYRFIAPQHNGPHSTAPALAAAASMYYMSLWPRSLRLRSFSLSTNGRNRWRAYLASRSNHEINALTMSNSSSAIVQKLWNYCNVLRDAGLSYGDYLEQLTYLLFLKMAHERTEPPFNQPSIIPAENDWPSLFEFEGIPLEHHYRDVLQNLGREAGMLGVIFRKAQNKIQNPALLRRLISDLIDREQWTALDADVKGDAYGGLLEKNAEDVKAGAGQYFTPRAPGPESRVPNPVARFPYPLCRFWNTMPASR